MRNSAPRRCRILSLLLMLGFVACEGGWGADEVKPLGRVATKDVTEISGLAASRHNRGVLWMHDDGAIRDVYAIRSSGEVIARLRLPEKLTDVEDLAIGPGPLADVDYLYLADIGDNEQRRPFVRLVRFPEPDLSTSGDDKLKIKAIEEFRLTYVGGPCDAEALMVDPRLGDVLIATKEKDTSRLFATNVSRLRSGATASLPEVGRIDVKKVSGGDISVDGRWIVLRREEEGWLWDRTDHEPVATALGRRPRIVPVLGGRQGRNGEAIAFDRTGQAYVTVSEGREEWIYAFRRPRF